jgi:hypothetical protein
MKKWVLVLILTIISLVLVFGSAEEAGKENAAIKQAALDYIEGWYEASVERMDRALHPDLNKKGVQVIPKTGKTVLNHLRKTNMIEYTRLGSGKNEEKQATVEVLILDVFKNTASVKTISPDFVDYLHLVKWEGQWKIVNVLWEPNR